MSEHNTLSTEELAALIKCRPASIRTRLCETGSFHGVVPIKLPTGRLIWPGDALERLAAHRAAALPKEAK